MYQPLKSTREALARATGDRVVRTVCQSCHAECGVLARVREGRLVKVEGDPEHPFNKGKACVKGLSIAHMLYHPARLRYPLRRVGERGEGKWQRISWEEALEIASEGLLRVRERHGPESIIASAGTQPRGNFVTTIRLGQALGTPNFFCPTHVCFLPAIAAGKITIGGEIMQETGPDYLNSRLIVIWGANPVISHPPRGRDVLEAVMDRGARLIVIDPRMTELAARADLWLQVRPGADDALVLSWLNVIINEGLYDEAFVERWCKGFPELRERVQEYTPERVAEITWVPADLIRQAARMYATVKPAAFHKRVAVEQHTNAFQTLRAMISLIAITGNIDVKGGNRFPQYPEGFISRNAIAFDPSRLLPPEVLARRLGAEKFPFLLEPEVGWIVAHTPSGVEAMVSGRPYPIKGLIAFNNIALNFEKSRAVWEGLKKLDFSLVSDFFMTPTAEMADLVLPAAMWPEKSEVCFAYYPNFITARVKAVEPQGECWDDKLMGMRLVRKMGVDPEGFYFPWNSVEEYNDYQVRGMGMSFSEFAERGYIVQERGERRYEASGFATPSGKVEL
ncbi:MAG: molybdopterin-dependent oxidoreductase, partial [Nitrospinota bacterium]